MRRLARWLLNALTVLSLLLCVATLTLWARSYIVADRYGHPGPSWYTYAASTRGVLVVAANQLSSVSSAGAIAAHRVGFGRRAPWTETLNPGPSSVIRSFHDAAGVTWLVADGGLVTSRPSPNSFSVKIFSPRRYVRVRHLVLAIAFAVLPASWMVLWCRDRGRRRRGSRRGLCPSCS